jgi:hypothetical protein
MRWACNPGLIAVGFRTNLAISPAAINRRIWKLILPLMDSIRVFGDYDVFVVSVDLVDLSVDPVDDESEDFSGAFDVVFPDLPE